MKKSPRMIASDNLSRKDSNVVFVEIRSLIAALHELLVEAEFKLPALYEKILSVEDRQLEFDLSLE